LRYSRVKIEVLRDTQDDKKRGTGLRTTAGCHPEAGSYGGGISGMSYSRVKNEVLRLAQDDRCLDVILNEVKDLAPKAVQNQARDPSGVKLPSG
jgi:hypothetical protein